MAHGVRIYISGTTVYRFNDADWTRILRKWEQNEEVSFQTPIDSGRDAFFDYTWLRVHEVYHGVIRERSLQHTASPYFVPSPATPPVCLAAT